MRTALEKCRQRGMATLIVTLVVLITLTLMVIFATKVGVFDQRMSGNENRYKEAFATAEAGLELATQRFHDQFFADTGATLETIRTNSEFAVGTGLNGQTAGAGQASFGVTVTSTGAMLGTIPVYRFTSTSVGADGTGRATVSREISLKQTLGGAAPNVPVIVSGSVGTGGDFNIVANPNGGGNGVPVSIWTGPYSATPTATVAMAGSSATCQLQYFDGNNPQCSNPSGNTELLSDGDGSTLSVYNSAFPDVLPNDPNFPSDLFQFLFGVSRGDWQTVYNLALERGQVAADCSGLDDTSGANYRLWWVTGDCNVGSNQVIGSETDPVILVIDDHQLGMAGGNNKIYGIPFIFDNPSNAATPSTDFSGSPAIYGALVSDVGGNAMQGSYSIVYDAAALTSLTSEDEPSNYDLVNIPGSWRDFN